MTQCVNKRENAPQCWRFRAENAMGQSSISALIPTVHDWQFVRCVSNCTRMHLLLCSFAKNQYSSDALFCAAISSAVLSNLWLLYFRFIWHHKHSIKFGWLIRSNFCPADRQQTDSHPKQSWPIGATLSLSLNKADKLSERAVQF